MQPSHRQQTGAACAVRLRQRIEQKRRIIVHRVELAEIRLRLIQIRPLVDVIGARRIKIDFLQKIDVGGLVEQDIGDLRKVGLQPILAPCPRFRAAVHEEAVVVLIRAKSDVPRQYAVILPGLRDGLRLLLVDVERLVVRDAVIVEEHIGHIPAREHQQHQQHDNQNFPELFHKQNPSNFFSLYHTRFTPELQSTAKHAMLLHGGIL